MGFTDFVLLIVITAAAIGAVGHSWIHSFFAKKEELLNKLHMEIEKGP
jgi:hypothetical protein